MSFTKTEIYNLALSALLLNKQFIDVATEENNYISNLNNFYNIALQSTIQDLDLDSLSQPITLELLATLDDENIPWLYVYKYPTNCAFMRRIRSGEVTDNKISHIPKRTGQYEGQKAIYTDEEQAVIEAIPKDVNLESFSAMTALAVAYKLAFLSAPLIVGKGAKALRKEIKEDYILAKIEAQETDSLENFNYDADWLRSELVAERLS